MSMTASRGSEQPETSIYLVSDLLSEWLIERDASQRRLMTSLARIAAVLVIAIVLILPLKAASKAAAIRSADATKQLSLVNDRIKAAGGDKTGPNASVDVKGMILNCQKQNASGLNAIISSFSCAVPSVALSGCKVEMVGGEVKFTGQGDADSFVTAGQFIQRLSNVTGSKGAVLTSANRGDSMGPDSVSFQFSNEIRAGKL